MGPWLCRRLYNAATVLFQKNSMCSPISVACRREGVAVAPLLAEHWTRIALAQRPDFSDIARNLLAFVPRFLELLQPSQMIILSTGMELCI